MTRIMPRRDGRTRPWVRINCWYTADHRVGSDDYCMARTEAEMLYVPPVLPTEGYPSRSPGRLEFWGRKIYYCMGYCSEWLCTPAVTPFEQHSLWSKP
jgi:hypothetical protein